LQDDDERRFGSEDGRQVKPALQQAGGEEKFLIAISWRVFMRSSTSVSFARHGHKFQYE
jgi:hypothetical protein